MGKEEVDGGLNKVVTVGNGGHKKTHCLHWQGRRPMALGAIVSHPSTTVVPDPGSSVSQRAQAVKATPVQPACWSTAVDEEDCAEEWSHDWESDWTED